MAESRQEVERALQEFGWDVHTEDPDALMGAHGKYHPMASFEAGERTSLIVSYVGRGGGILSANWAGVERLPTPSRET